MRGTLHPALERCRTGGEGLNGSFLISGPSGRRLSIIASDGSDWEELGLEPPSWEHVSVKAQGSGWVVPNWKEMCFVKDLFWNEGEWVVQFHPSAAEYVNIHGAVLHLWRCLADFPKPPVACV